MKLKFYYLRMDQIRVETLTGRKLVMMQEKVMLFTNNEKNYLKS